MIVANAIPENLRPDRVSLVAIDFLNRSSSLFFNCLLDGHPQIIHGFAQNYPAGASSRQEAARAAFENLASSMIWHYSPRDFPFSFREFEPLFNQYADEFGFSQKSAFVAAHYALAKLLGKDLKKIKWIAYHPHGHSNIGSVMRAKRDFPNQKLILTVRDPRAAIWGNLRADKKVPLYELLPQAPAYWWAYKRIFARNEIRVVRHEDIHTNYPRERVALTEFLQIHDEASLDQATLFGKPWDGSAKNAVLSNTGRKSSRPDPAFVTDDWKQGLSRFDLFLIQAALAGFMREFGYLPYSKPDGKCKQVELDYGALWNEFTAKTVPASLRPALGGVASTPFISVVPKTIIHAMIAARTARNYLALYSAVTS
jgi:hypothetical protein